MRKKRIKLVPIIVILLFICLIFGALYVFREYLQKEDQPTPLNKDNVEKTYTTSFTLAGNVLLNREMWYDSQNEDGGYDFSYMFEYLNDIMKKSDINLYSEQSIIGGSGLGTTGFVNGAYNYNAPTELGDELIKIGFNAVSLANYHAFDKGIAGINNSIDYWESKKIVHSGTSKTEADRLKNNIFESDGIKYALLSYTLATDTTFTEEYAINIYSEEKVKSDIDAIKSNADVIIVSMDWSSQYTEVTEEQRTIVNYLISQGVNVIVGNTGNTIEPIEIIDNTLVCYSLGNLISGHTLIDSRISAVVDFELSLTKGEDKKEIKFNDIDVLLTYGYNLNTANYKVIPFSKINTELYNYGTYYNKYKELLTKDKEYIKLYAIGDENGDTKSES